MLVVQSQVTQYWAAEVMLIMPLPWGQNHTKPLGSLGQLLVNASTSFGSNVMQSVAS